MDKHISQLTPSELLEHYKAEFDAGNGGALLSAVSVCLNLGCDAPKWVVTEFNVACINYESGQAWTLDDAFNIQRQTVRRQKRYRKDQMASLIWQMVVMRHRDGESIGRALFELVADELNAKRSESTDGLKFNGTDVQDAYYGFKGVTKK